MTDVEAPCRSRHSFYPDVSRLHPISFPLAYSKLCFFPCSVQDEHQSFSVNGASFSKCPSAPLRAAGAAEVVQHLIFLWSLSFFFFFSVYYKHTKASYFMGTSCEHHT